MNWGQLRQAMEEHAISDEWDIQIGTPTGLFNVASCSMFPNVKIIGINTITPEQVNVVIKEIKDAEIKNKIIS